MFEDNGREVIWVFRLSNHPNPETYLAHLREGPLIFSSSEDLACAWSNRDFGIRGRGPMRQTVLNLRSAMNELNLAVAVTVQGLMTGFNLIYVDKFPADLNKEWIERGREHQALSQAWKESGIEEGLRKAGKDWFVLGHRFISQDGETLTWLNPWDQEKYQAGWFSFEDLKQWANDEGSVLKKRRKSR